MSLYVCRPKKMAERDKDFRPQAPLPVGGAPAVPALSPRERILAAALELFVEQGYFNTNVPDISKKSRCSVGSIYHHFINKEEIAAQLYADGLKQFRDTLTAALKPDSSIEEAVRTLVQTLLIFAEDHRRLARYLWLARHQEFLSAKVVTPTVVGFDDLGRKLTHIIKLAVRRKEIPDIDAQILWALIIGIPLSFIRDWLDGTTRHSPRSVADTIARASWAALKGI